MQGWFWPAQAGQKSVSTPDQVASRLAGTTDRVFPLETRGFGEPLARVVDEDEPDLFDQCLSALIRCYLFCGI